MHVSTHSSSCSQLQLVTLRTQPADVLLLRHMCSPLLGELLRQLCVVSLGSFSPRCKWSASLNKFSSSMRALCCEERGCIRELACRRSLHENGGMKAKAGTPSRNMRECIIDITSAFRGVHAAHKQVDVVVTTARFWRNSGFILGGIRARRGNSSLGANQARKHSVGHNRMFVSRFVVVSPVAVVMSESPLELAGLFQYHITSNSRNY